MARKPKKIRPQAPSESDLGTHELRRHYQVEVNGEGSKKRARVLNHPLDRYFSREEISMEQYRAGCNLFNDYSVSHTHRNTLMLLGVTAGVSIQVDFDNPHTALERYMRALKCLNRISRMLAQEVCIEGKSIAEVRDIFSWSKRNTGMDRLCETLDELDDFYRDERKRYREWLDRQTENMHSPS